MQVHALSDRFEQLHGPYLNPIFFITVLKPLTDDSPHKLQSNENCIDAIKTVKEPDDYKIVPFDLKSPFTSIPLALTLDCTETAINNCTINLSLPTDDLMHLLNLFFLLSEQWQALKTVAWNSYGFTSFRRRKNRFAKHQGALATPKRTLPLRLRYVDDTFTAVHKDEIDDFHEHLHRQNADIHAQFTKENEVKC